MSATAQTKHARQLQEVTSELQWVSDRLSSQVRYLAAGLLAITWALITAPVERSLPIRPRGLIVVAVLAILALTVDLVQYAAAHRLVNSRRKRLELSEEPDDGYDPKNLWYRTRGGCFYCKVPLMIAACLAFLLAIIPPLFGF